MNILYKRIVTLGMVSITALLGWIYCLMAFRDKPVYIALVSIIVVGAVFVLLNAVMDLHNAKEAAREASLKAAATELVQTVAAQQNNNDTEEELLRLNKATYVQIRREIELLSQINTSIEQLSETSQVQLLESTGTIKTSNEALGKSVTAEINKLAKIIVKYNETNTTKIIDALDNLNNEISEMSKEISESSTDSIEKYAAQLAKLSDDLSSLRAGMVSSMDKLAGELAKVQLGSSSGTINISTPSAVKATSSEDTEATTAPVVEESIEKAEEPVAKEEKTEEKTTVNEADIFGEGLLSQDSLNDIISAINNPEEETEEIEDVAEEADEATDDAPAFDVNSFFDEFGSDKQAEEKAEEIVEEKSSDESRQMSQDEIAAMFAASQEAYRAKSDDDFQVENHPESMDQFLIDALLDTDDNFDIPDFDDDEEEAEASSTPIADVIPFPNKETAEEADEPVAVTPVSDDPNKQLSPDEIAALFASASAPAKGPEPEPVAVTPVSDDPNKQLSPDEIAALFASASAPAKEPEPEPVAVTPVSDDPNKQLSPDEIAALFASASAPAKEPEPEPVAVTPVSDDPNKQLSPDEIAALFASASAPAKEPEPEPVAVTPVSDDPNKQLSPDEIAALFASMGG